MTTITKEDLEYLQHVVDIQENFSSAGVAKMNLKIAIVIYEMQNENITKSVGFPKELLLK